MCFLYDFGIILGSGFNDKMNSLVYLMLAFTRSCELSVILMAERVYSKFIIFSREIEKPSKKPLRKQEIPEMTRREESLVRKLAISRRTSSLASPSLPVMSETLVKIMLLGESSSGKTQVANRLTRKKFSLHTTPTAGIELSNRSVKLDNQTSIKAQIIDSSGLDRFISITKQYWAVCNGALIIFDITSPSSFEKAKNIAFSFTKSSNRDPLVMIIGNKLDLEDTRQVNTEDAQSFCLENSFLYHETSALENFNIESAFEVFLSNLYYSLKIESRPANRILNPLSKPDAAQINSTDMLSPLSPPFYKVVGHARSLIGSLNLGLVSLPIEKDFLSIPIISIEEVDENNVFRKRTIEKTHLIDPITHRKKTLEAALLAPTAPLTRSKSFSKSSTRRI